MGNEGGEWVVFLTMDVVLEDCRLVDGWEVSVVWALTPILYCGDLHMQISYPRVKTFSSEVLPLAPSPLGSGQYSGDDRMVARIEAVQWMRVQRTVGPACAGWSCFRRRAAWWSIE